jgi:hypothetical protein
MKYEMKRFITIVCASLFIGIPAAAAQDKPGTKDSDEPHLVTTGQISNVDIKKKTLKIRSAADPLKERVPTGSGRAGRGGIGLPRGIPFPGGRGTVGRGIPPIGGGGKNSGGRESKVTVTDQTVFKDGDETIALSDLKVGDYIVVSGTVKHGNDLEASDIQRTRR